jgi:membrane-associated phospholipid phosphatase
MNSKTFIRTIGIILLITTNNAYAGPFTNKNAWGDLFLSGSILYAYGMTMGKEDFTGALQLTGSIVSSQLATEALKTATHEKRPNRSDTKSFPSGHASGAFSGAMFVHKRYGWKSAIPPYLMAGIVGFQRVSVKAHYPHDILAGAAVSALFTWVFVSDYDINVSVGKDSVGLGFKTLF